MTVTAEPARKDVIDDLAICGGRPLFPVARPIGQLDAPDVDEYLDYLRQSYDARHLTNDGPVVVKLERELSGIHGTRHCIAVANAGLALMMLMRIFSRGRQGKVIMPAFSYRGLPHFCLWAGQSPEFCDVDPRTHFLDPRDVEQAIGPDTTSILGVCNFNDPGDIAGLCRVGDRHGIPVFFDSVYAVGGTYRGTMLGACGLAEVYSLHATKLLNGFEGGYVTTNDDKLAQMLRWQRNFALPGLQPSPAGSEFILGLNAKLNELHAAMAMRSIYRLEEIIARNFNRFDAYRRGLARVPGLELLPYVDGERVNYQMAVADVGSGWPLTRDQTVGLLRAEGAAISAYYSPPLHRSEHCPAGLVTRALPVSEDLARKFVQLPVGEMTSVDDAHQICSLLEFVSANGPAITRRLSRQGSH